MSKRRQVIFVGGSSGAGKTTHCELLAKRYPEGITHIGVGKLLREFVENNLYHPSSQKKLAQLFNQDMKAGRLSDPKIIWKNIILPAILKSDISKIIIIEGFPRDMKNLNVALESPKIEILGLVYLSVNQQKATERREQQKEEQSRPEESEAEAGRKNYDCLVIDVLEYFHSIKRLRIIDVSSDDIGRNQRRFAETIFYVIALANFVPSQRRSRGGGEEN